MRRKIFSIAVLTLVCSISLFALGGSNGYVSSLLDSVKSYPMSNIFFAGEGKNNSSKNSVAERKSANVEKARKTTDAVQSVPDRIVYFILFNHLVGLKKQSEQLQATGDSSLNYHDLYKRQANLSETQTDTLFQTAQNCMTAVEPIDAQAKSVIDQARAAFPDGALEEGQQIPPPPAQLSQLQQQKDDAVLYYRDQLRSNLGETKFAEFDQFAREKIAPQVENLTSANIKIKGEAE